MKIASALLIAPLLVACAETATSTRQSPGPSPQAVQATLATDLRNPQAAREFLHGDTELRSLPAGGMVLLLDGGSRPGLEDGFVDQVFVLQQEQGVEPLRRRVNNAEIFYAGSSLLVRAQGRPEILLAVAGAAGADVWREYFPRAAAPSFRRTGYGLSRRNGLGTLPLDGIDEESLLSILPACGTAVPGEVGTASACDSGGEGSTSCSTTCSPTSSCSTSCDSGYYSCCDSGKCTCTCVSKTPVEPYSAPPAPEQG